MPDALDACQGSDDTLDLDGNGTPDGCDWVQLEADLFFACGRVGSGRVYCWGANGDGQTDAPAGATDYFIDVAPGADHTCALRADGSVSCWGDNSKGESTPPAAVTFSDIASGNNATCGVRTLDNIIQCWGGVGYGILGAPGTPFVAVDAGGDSACGHEAGGGVVCWGGNGLPLENPSGDFQQISLGYGQSAVGLLTNGNGAAWGMSDFMVQGSFTAGAPYQHFSANWGTVCAVDLNNELECWGSDVNDILTDMPAGTFVSVENGNDFACAITTEGTAICWGNSIFGQDQVPEVGDGA